MTEFQKECILFVMCLTFFFGCSNCAAIAAAATETIRTAVTMMIWMSNYVVV